MLECRALEVLKKFVLDVTLVIRYYSELFVSLSSSHIAKCKKTMYFRTAAGCLK